ncbi:uncharacterized protein LOC143892625 [Tasmannia lanceolata]|uniref:uncharacterized protein LOC143892625 n=1 Tax=Tasmannia lanceolata TaxID=3420 RepID=UPI00406404FD
MVNVVRLLIWLLHQGIKLVTGLRPQSVEIEPGTVVNMWVPSQMINGGHYKYKKTKSKKPSVLLIHGFAGEGILTWAFQVLGLVGKYNVYVPDLLFFGFYGSATSSPDRSVEFHSECLAKAMVKLGVEKCGVVGFSYGAILAFKMAQFHPELVSCLVITGSLANNTKSIINPLLQRLGFSSVSDLLLPTTPEGINDLLSAGVHINIWFPYRFLQDYLKLMFSYRQERGELLQKSVINDEDAVHFNFQQNILLLWGEYDQIFNFEVAKKLKEELGQRAILHALKDAGHLAQLERPLLYNKHLKEFLACNLSPN